MCAKIKTLGLQDMIDVPNDELKEFIRKREAGEMDKNIDTTIGQWGGRAGDVRSWILDEEMPKGDKAFEEEKEKQIAERRRIMMMAPAERARANIGYFKLFYWAIYQKDPDQKIVDKAVELMMKFFEENPKWSKPSIKHFMDITKIKSKKFINDEIRDKYVISAWRALELTELNELQMVRFNG